MDYRLRNALLRSMVFRSTVAQNLGVGVVSDVNVAANAAIQGSKIVAASAGVAGVIPSTGIVDALIAAAAGIQKSKLAALNIGDGDIAAAGLTNASIAATAAIARSKLGLIGAPNVRNGYTNDTVVQPSTTRDTLVLCALVIDSKKGDDGNWQFQSDASNPPTTTLNSFEVKFADADAVNAKDVKSTSLLGGIVQAGNNYRFHQLTSAGTPTYSNGAPLEWPM